MSDCCLNCEAGRTMGCRTYCCQLLVRLTEEDAQRLYPERPTARFLEKAEDGFCIHLDRMTHRCNIWEQRPEVCRGYDCNSDFLLQVAVAEGFTSIVELTGRAQRIYLPSHLWVKVPDEADSSSSASSSSTSESHSSEDTGSSVIT
ncbi:MAG: YkgJ family cysteine cluster protein [Nitrospira sp.]|nr:YkgJ family cysteine cluster protein [Nitrospira sp.]